MPPAENKPNDQPQAEEGQLPASPPAPVVVSGGGFNPASNEPYAPPATPVLPTPVSGDAGKPKRKKKLLLFFVIILVLLAAAGIYVFAFYLPNSPTHIYMTSLDRTAQAADQLTTYIGSRDKKGYTSSKIDGSLKFTSATISGDGTLTAEGNKDASSAKLDVDIAGQKFTANSKVVKAKGQEQPDIYVQLTGIKTMLDGVGLNQYDKLDGEWVVIDHTLLDSVAASLDSGSKSSSSTLTSPTNDQIQDALKKINDVNKQYVFTTDQSKSILKDPKSTGKTTREGRTVYGYTVGYNKDNLKAYIRALQAAVNSSSLNDWIKQITGKSVSALDLSGLMKSIDSADSNYTFTMYVDAKTKLISALHFKDPKNSDYFELGQNYTGGSTYPFSFKFVSNSDPKNGGTFTMNTSIDSDTDVVKVSADIDAKTDDSPITFKFDLTGTPGKDAVNVTAPTGAVPITTVLHQLGLDSLLSGGTSSGSGDTGLPFSLTQ